MGKTEISWADEVWNPVRGCSRVSEGCRHCYAETTAARFSGPGQPYEGLVTRKLKVISDDEQRMEARWTGEVRFVASALAEPLKRKKPTRYFVNSMSDLFHDGFSNEQIAAVFGVMAAAPQHTFMVLTKRPKRMREWFEWAAKLPLQHGDQASVVGYLFADAIRESSGSVNGFRKTTAFPAWPLPNVWIGVSVENQAAADERIPLLLQTPAAVRFVSAEPLLGPLDLRRYMWPTHWSWDAKYETPEAAMAAGAFAARKRQALVSALAAFVDQVIAGCESGPGARPCEVRWLRSLRDQCAEADVPFFLKQAWAEFWPDGTALSSVPITAGPGSKRKPGGIIELPYLDGVQWRQLPEVKP